MATVLQRDLQHTLRLLRQARDDGDESKEQLFEGKLNRLLDDVPRKSD